jgi:hypothetical protein
MDKQKKAKKITQFWERHDKLRCTKPLNFVKENVMPFDAQIFIMDNFMLMKYVDPMMGVWSNPLL